VAAEEALSAGRDDDVSGEVTTRGDAMRTTDQQAGRG
jgi:hypothetical protein